MREAARLEQARVYGTTCKGTRTEARGVVSSARLAAFEQQLQAITAPVTPLRPVLAVETRAQILSALHRTGSVVGAAKATGQPERVVREIASAVAS